MDFTIAKAMIESGYVPENDIAVVAHGAEEWEQQALSLTGQPAHGE